MTRYAILAAALLLAGACEPPYEPQPPTPPPPAHVDAADLVLPTDADGDPALAEVPAGGPHSVRAVYDDTVDDPLRRWAECLDRVAACYHVNEGRVDGCVDFIELCDDSAGGYGCCPSGCIEDFQSARARGLSEDDAVDQSFMTGACIPGFQEQLAAAGLTPGEVSP